MKPSMFFRMKNVVDEIWGGRRDHEHKPNKVASVPYNVEEGYGKLHAKLKYHRPLFLGLTKGEEGDALNKQHRLSVTPKNVTLLPFNAGYCEVVNAGKTDYNEDCSVAVTVHLESLSNQVCSCEVESHKIQHGSKAGDYLNATTSNEQKKLEEAMTSSSVADNHKPDNIDCQQTSSTNHQFQGSEKSKTIPEAEVMLNNNENAIAFGSSDEESCEASGTAKVDEDSIVPPLVLENASEERNTSNTKTDAKQTPQAPTPPTPSMISPQSVQPTKISGVPDHCKRCSSPLRVDYFAIFDGHAGEGAALYASEVLHEILIERLREVQHLLVKSDCSNLSLPAYLTEQRKELAAMTNLCSDSLITGVLQDVMVITDKHLAADAHKFHVTGGCTALLVVVALGKVFVAGAGDCRAVLCRTTSANDKGDKKILAIPMSQDFTPNSERRRLQYLAYIKPCLLGEHFTRLEFIKRLSPNDVGKKMLYRDYHMTGWCYKEITEDDLRHPLIHGNGKSRRLLGTIGVTRGLGDHTLLALNHIPDAPVKPFMSAVPEVRSYDLSGRSHDDDDVIIVGSDGLWDVTSNETAAQIVKSILTDLEKSDCNRYCIAAKALVTHARGHIVNGLWKMADGRPASFDDISVFVIPLKAAGICHKCWQSLVTEYFRRRQNLDLSEFGQRVTVDAFLLMTSNNKVLKQLLVPEATSWLMDKHLLPVIHNCFHVLTDIDISNCSQLSSSSLHSLAVKCRNLTKVSLKGCIWVDKDNFKQLVINNRGLRKIDVSWCWSLDDDCLINAAFSCPFLEELILSNTRTASDSALQIIAMKYKELKYLSVKGCWQVTNRGIRAIVDHCKDLKVLHH
ncbi:uncharacterized protein LOC143464867 isoform X2 [Clavelina lepadiformis]|uniref:uncharacterized protein LOC143464867 isoform X2 n=1 Tax=Clavelina lepadiformis TaxID=159417 RepID=UPI00404113BD